MGYALSVSLWQNHYFQVFGFFKNYLYSLYGYCACKFLENIHKDFVWDKKRPNIKHSSLISNYPCGGLKDIDIPSKFKSLHLNWLNRLFDNNFHPWKQIPLYYFKRVSTKFDLFHPNLSVPSGMMNTIPMFYRNIIKYWQDISFSPPLMRLWFCLSLYVSIHSLKLATRLLAHHFSMILTRFTCPICLPIIGLSYHGPKHP